MLPKRGRPPVVFMMTVERELTQGDIFGLEIMNDQPLTAAPTLQRLREIHHRAARKVAAGLSLVEVGIEVGRSAKRIGDLCQDPAFKELVEYYRTQIEEVDLMGARIAYADYADINDLARGEIIARLEDPTKMKDIPVDELRHLMISTGDRTTMPAKTATPAAVAPTRITFNMGNRDIRPKDMIIEAEAGETLVEITDNSEDNEDQDNDQD